jgi:protein-S-isoprenylcysteine O-methyltransferase Ste14
MLAAMRVLPQTPLDWVLLAVGTATAIIIAVAQQDFFLDSRAGNPRVRALQDVGIGIAVTHFGVLLVRGSAGPGWAVAGIVLYLAAASLFLSSVEAARRVPLARAMVDDPLPSSLVTTGPFALVRHPIYISYTMAWLAAPIATHGPVAALFSLVAIAIYVIAARREEQLLEERFGEAYRRYRMATGCLLPRLLRRPRRSLHPGA